MDETANSETEENEEDTNVLSPQNGTASNRTETRGQPDPSEQNGSLAAHREENRVQSAVAPSWPLSGVHGNDGPRHVTEKGSNKCVKLILGNFLARVKDILLSALVRFDNFERNLYEKR